MLVVGTVAYNPLRICAWSHFRMLSSTPTTQSKQTIEIGDRGTFLKRHVYGLTLNGTIIKVFLTFHTESKVVFIDFGTDNEDSAQSAFDTAKTELDQK